MCRYRILLSRIVLFTVLLLAGHIFLTCFVWKLEHGRTGGTEMFIVAPGSVIDPDSIELDYDGEYLRRSSLSIANTNPGGMINSKSYSKLYFVEDKERDEVYFSTDGFHYEPIPLNEKDNVTTRAYRWIVACLGPQEKL